MSSGVATANHFRRRLELRVHMRMAARQRMIKHSIISTTRNRSRLLKIMRDCFENSYVMMHAEFPNPVLFFFFVIILYTSCSAYDKPGLIPRRISWSSICAPAMVSFLRSCSPSRLSQVATAFGLSALILVCLRVCHILSRRLHSSRFLPAKVFSHRPCPPGRADQPTRRALACWSPLSFCRLLRIR